MPKIKKRRRGGGSTETTAGEEPALHAVAVVQQAKHAASIMTVESCLEEMAAQALPPQQASTLTEITASTTTTKPTGADEKQKTELCDPSLGLMTSSSSSSLPKPPAVFQERIVAWNRAMRTWQSTGKYTPGLLPSLDNEVARHFKVQALSTFLLESCKELKMPAFERWLIDAKLEEQQTIISSSSFSDPVLPGYVTVQSPASQRLLEEIRETGVSRDSAKKLVRDLCRRTDTVHSEMVQMERTNTRTPLRKGDRITVEGLGPTTSSTDDVHHEQQSSSSILLTLVYHRKKWKKPFCVKLNKTHYDKLNDMFLRVHNSTTGPSVCFVELGSNRVTRVAHAFHLLVMVLLLRYSALSGGQLLLDLRGGGMQGAIHGELFAVLRDMFPHGPLLEGFASPLNAYLPSFGSAFPDHLDWHFGSTGSFLSLDISEGCCEANPPFSPGIMSAMTDRIQENLVQADHRQTMLTFVVIVPNAGDYKDSQRAAAKRFGGVPLQKLISSSHWCRCHFVLAAKEHGYVEGAQHMRPTRYKESLYDTSVVILQSKMARRQELDEKQLEDRIRQGFASHHRKEVELRKASVGDFS